MVCSSTAPAGAISRTTCSVLSSSSSMTLKSISARFGTTYVSSLLEFFRLGLKAGALTFIFMVLEQVPYLLVGSESLFDFVVFLLPHLVGG